MGEKSPQAEALLDSFRDFELPWDPDVVADELRDQGLHPLADLMESQQDQIHILKVKLARAERKVIKKRKR